MTSFRCEKKWVKANGLIAFSDEKSYDLITPFYDCDHVTDTRTQ